MNHIQRQQVEKFKQWVIERHRKTNHMYDEYIPYEFHLRMVLLVGQSYMNLINKKIIQDYIECYNFNFTYEEVEMNIEMSLFSHDVIEDARTSYNKVKDNSNFYVAETSRALTVDSRARNRNEKQSPEYFQLIHQTPGATFGKLSDRIANVQYSILTQSDMTETYRGEHDLFVKHLYRDDLDAMFVHLDQLFSKNKIW